MRILEYYVVSSTLHPILMHIIESLNLCSGYTTSTPPLSSNTQDILLLSHFSDVVLHSQYLFINLSCEPVLCHSCPLPSLAALTSPRSIAHSLLSPKLCLPLCLSGLITSYSPSSSRKRDENNLAKWRGFPRLQDMLDGPGRPKSLPQIGLSRLSRCS